MRFVSDGVAPPMWFGFALFGFMLVVAFLVATVGAFLAPVLHKRRRRALCLRTKQDPRPPILFLRSFTRWRLQAGWTAYRPDPPISETGPPWPRMTTTMEEGRLGIDRIEPLLEAFATIGPLVALTVGKDKSLVSPKILPLRELSESEWRSVLRPLCHEMRAIVLLPEVSDSLVDEMNLVRYGRCRRRVIVFMPPAIDNQRPANGFKEAWDQMRSELAASERGGFRLPPYRPAGCLYIPDCDFAPASEPVLFRGTRRAHFEEAVRAILPRARGYVKTPASILQGLLPPV